MRIFYNKETRQLIIVMDDFACSVYLQSDETPDTKANEVVHAYRDNKANVSVCNEIDLTVEDPVLPAEDGPKESTDDEILRPTNGNGKTI